ncbi:uncharacterized protein J3R85_015442 [Psidium guajava]|nr:uncharacterized protein J3R85_015442 [Psidium guajava]
MSAEILNSTGINFESSGLRSGGCNETVDISVKRKSESAWRFCYARRKRVRNQNGSPHISRSSEAIGMGSEDSVYQHPISSDHVVRNIKSDIQHHRLANPDSAEASLRGTEFELSGVKSRGCKVKMDTQAKGKSQNVCRFCYVRSKRMHRQNSAPHFTHFLKAKSLMGFEDLFMNTSLGAII